jgi:predicted lipoprotein with Yx(FWY)xxD motif
MTAGRMLTTYVGESLYTWDKDGLEKSNCAGECLKEWAPVIAPNIAHAPGEWSIFERAPGVKQWAFRKKPVYTHIADDKVRSFEGSDVPGWHNVYMQRAPAPPKEFTVQDTRGGQVLADSHGKTIYIYNCTEDTVDRSACDNPDSPQMYRFAMCGGGDPDVCVKTFPYVIAAQNAESGNRVWTAMDINPKTGHRAAPGEAGALHVWAYRGRPVYTFSGDKKAGDIEANAWGQGTGSVNGFKAFWLRDDFRENDA